MPRLRRFVLRLLAFLRPAASERELAREIDGHLALIEDQYERRGMTRDEARLAARCALGGVDQTKERHRDARSFPWLEDLRRDVPYAWRSFAKNPGFTSVAVLTLALGIGANTAIFSVVNSVLLRPLTYSANSDRLVRLMANFPAADSPTGRPRRMPVGLSTSDIADLRSRTRTLSEVGVADSALVGLSGHEDAARLQGAVVSSSIFPMLGARPLLGRAFGPEDEVPGQDAVMLVSYKAWHRFFGGAADVLGRNVVVDSVLGPRRQRTYSVIGVMPPEFQFPDSRMQFWLPSYPFPWGTNNVVRTAMLGLLADGVPMQAAADELGSIVREIRKHGPGVRYELVREHSEMVETVRPALIVLSVAVGFVLLIACVNVANLLLARAAARQREIAVRAALGAGRGRLVRQAFTESVMLALLGGAGGAILAVIGIGLLRNLATTISRVDLPAGVAFPRLNEVGVDTSILMFTAGTSLMTGVLFGLAPALRSSLSHPIDAVRASGRSGVSSLATSKGPGLRSVLVVAQIAMATVLLIGGGLLIHSFMKLARVDAGYEPDRVLTFQVSLPVASYPDARLTSFAETLVERLRSVPGVRAAAYANQLPMVQLRDTGGGLWRTPSADRKFAPDAADARFVSRDYFEAMRIRIVAGRGFTEQDGAGQPRVMLVNEALARRQFPDENSVGQTVFIGRNPMPWQIVGLVANIRQFGLDREPEPQFFVDLRQWSPGGTPLFPVGAYYVLSINGDPESLIQIVRRVVGELDSQAALFNVARMESIVATTIARPRMYAVLLGIFAGVGVMLAIIGIYGVMAYAVTQRTREIGIRMAIGAQKAEVMTLVLRQGLRLTVAGIVIGVAGAAATTRYLEGMLFGVTPFDGTTFATVSSLFAAVATVASYVPAHRATRVDPITALRCE